MLWCLLAGLQGLRAAVHPHDSNACDPLSQSCVVADDAARMKLLEHHMQGSVKPKVAAAAVTPSADGHLPASTPTTVQGLRISFYYRLDASRSTAEKDYIEKKLMPAVSATLSRSMRVQITVHHTVNVCPALCGNL
jgi:hypothetical protein